MTEQQQQQQLQQQQLQLPQVDPIIANDSEDPMLKQHQINNSADASDSNNNSIDTLNTANRAGDMAALTPNSDPIINEPKNIISNNSETDNIENTINNRDTNNVGTDDAVTTTTVTDTDTTNDNKDESTSNQEIGVDILPVIDMENTEPAPPPPQQPDMDNLPHSPIPEHQKKHAAMAIKAVKRLKDSRPFHLPVDTKALNIPYYYNYIKKPMDLATIERKLNNNAYETPEQINDDFDRMIKNAILFNGTTSGIAQMGRNIQASFEKHMLNMPAKDQPQQPQATKSRKRNRNSSNENGTLDDENQVVIRRAQTHNGRPKREIHPPKSKDIYPYENKRPKSKKLQQAMKFCSSIIKELSSKKYSSFNYPFLEPVDPVAMNLPSYSEYVKTPMDLGTISDKLSNWEYHSMEEFESDVKLVFKNCYAFNPDGTIVNMMGHRLEDVFNSKWADRPIYTDYDDSESGKDEYDSEEYSDDDASNMNDESDIDETLITNPAIQYLEEQLVRMKNELEVLKRQELDKIRKERRLARGTKRRSKKKIKRRSSKSGTTGTRRDRKKLKTVVTYDMKKCITEHINDLSSANLDKVIKIIMPNSTGQEEVELDLDTLDNNTILTLYNSFFRQFDERENSIQNKNTNGSGANSYRSARDHSPLSPSGQSNKKKRSKALSQEEESRQIEKIRNKLAYLDHASPLSQNGSPLNMGYMNKANVSNSSSSSDDDDDEDSESEEE